MRGNVQHRPGRPLPYRARFDAGPDPATGKRRMRSKSFATRREADLWLAERTADRERGRLTHAGGATVADALAAWLASQELAVELGDLAPSTCVWYRSAVERHLVPGLGAARVDALTAADLERFYAEKLRNGRLDGRGGLGASSVRRLHVTLAAALRHAVRRGLIPASPVDALDRRPPQPRSRAGQVWDGAQVARFVAHVAEDRLGAAYRLAAVSGMRRGEVLGLAWGDVDLAAARATIRRTLVMVAGQPQPGKPKTAKSARTVHLDAGTVAALRRWRTTQRRERLAWGAGWQDTGYVFTREDGQPVRPDWFYRRFLKLAAAAGLPRIPLHGLRHSAATWHLQAGTPAKVVAEMLGHASVTQTLDIYSAVLPGMHEAAVAALGAALD